MTRLLLDSSPYIAFKRRHPEIVEILPQTEEIWVSPIVLGELAPDFSKEADEKATSASYECFGNPLVPACWS